MKTHCWLLLALLSVCSAAAQPTSLDESRRYAQQAMAAYEAGDYAGYLENMRQAEALRPGHPGLIYNLASAYALNGYPTEALERLSRYATMGLVADPAADTDFTSLAHTKAFADVVALLNSNRHPVGEGTVAFTLADSTFIPEGIAFDSVSGDFFIGSVHQRRIVRVNAEGVETLFADTEDGLWSVLGMAVDADRRRLWVVTAAIPQTRDVTEEDAGRTALVLFDLVSEDVVRTYELSTSDRPQWLGDVTVGSDGTAYATDGRSGALYAVPLGAEAPVPVLPAGTLASPQGLCFIDGRLYLADYSLGILAVDLQGGATEVLPAPPNTTLLGVDGLACHGRSLVAVQNGVRPHRVVQLELNEDGNLDRADVLEAAHPFFDEPTLGVMVGETFYFVANSHWSAFDADGRLAPDAELAPPIIVKTELTR